MTVTRVMRFGKGLFLRQVRTTPQAFTTITVITMEGDAPLGWVDVLHPVSYAIQNVQLRERNLRFGEARRERAARLISPPTPLMGPSLLYRNCEGRT